ncbi:MAG: cytochrome P450, partial [Pseudomonadota bacterium]
MITPPIPPSRPAGRGLLRTWQSAKRNLFAALPERLYRAWLAETRTPLFTSYLANQPSLVREVLVERPEDFPKSAVQARALGDLLGRSVFVTNGAEWARARRLIGPALASSRPAQSFDAMLTAAEEMAERLPLGPVEIEAQTSHAAADVICRTMFSLPVDGALARQVFDAFRRYQRAAPMVSLADLAGMPGWLKLSPRRRRQARAAAEIRALLAQLVALRAAEIEAGRAPDDLATALMTATDPETGAGFSHAEVIDQIGVFFLAGHETSASALAWALYCVAADPEIQNRLAREAAPVFARRPGPRDIAQLRLSRDVFRETLRLYPPVAMMVRE